MSNSQNQVIALAGLLQATNLVEQIARSGKCSDQELETSVNSLFAVNPEQTIDVYGDIKQLKRGLEAVKALFSKNSQAKQLDPIRYALAIMHLESKLRKQPKMLRDISKGLEQAKSPAEHFGLLHENTLASLANTYQNTISTLSLRIQVSGEEKYLQMEYNATKIRMLLLASVRAAMLWHQVGGHRWHFIFKRASLAKSTNELLAAF